MKHNVYLFLEVRVKLSGIEADTHAKASEKAQAMVDDRLHEWLDRDLSENLDGVIAEYAEYTEEAPHLVLVDQLDADGEMIDSNSIWLDAQGNLADLAGASDSVTPAPAPAPGWQPFDYDNVESGMYWVRGCRPEYDIDVDDYGRTIGIPTGNSTPFTSLVHIETYEDGEISVEPVDRWATGDFAEDDVISEYMELVIPN